MTPRRSPRSKSLPILLGVLAVVLVGYAYSALRPRSASAPPAATTLRPQTSSPAPSTRPGGAGAAPLPGRSDSLRARAASPPHTRWTRGRSCRPTGPLRAARRAAVPRRARDRLLPPGLASFGPGAAPAAGVYRPAGPDGP